MNDLDLNTKSKTTITGSPRDFSQTELDARITAYAVMYKATSHSTAPVRADSARQFLQLVSDHLAQGYSLQNELPLSCEYPTYQAWLTKPESLQAGDLAAQAITLKSEYVAELEAERIDFQQRLIQQLKEKDEEKEAIAQAKAAAKRQSEYEKLAFDCFKPLVIP